MSGPPGPSEGAAADPGRLGVSFTLDGVEVTVAQQGISLLEALREHLGARSPKDGCSPQGQCGCCTVLVDGAPRVACVTPLRRVAGRAVQTVDGLGEDVTARWAEAFCATGASQCGFCTPGIVVRLEALRRKGTAADDEAAVDQALLAHLCRCTGWRTIHDAFSMAVGGSASAAGTSSAGGSAAAGSPARDLAAASRRAGLEGGVDQLVSPAVALGRGGFADDEAPPGALVAVPDGAGGWSLGETLAEARAGAGRAPGRHSTEPLRHPVDLPPGEWPLVLQTAWVDPAYLETDASWCEPGGEPASPLGNGGAFGGKVASPLPAVARRLADETGRPVRVLWSREDTVRSGPKRPPLAAGIDPGRGRVSVRVARCPGVREALVAGLGPGLDVDVEEVDVVGPPTSLALRAAGWAEGVALRAAALGQLGAVTSPSGATAWAEVATGGLVVGVRCGDPLDEVVLRSYCVGAAHAALSWVTSEGIGVGEDGVPADLTVRSLGVLRAVDTPPIEVHVEPARGVVPVRGSDAVFAAVAAAVWAHQGFPARWPTGVRLA